MPTITPTGRATPGETPDQFRLPKTSIRAQTGMNLPTPPKAEQAAAAPTAPAQALFPKTGQSDIQQEDTGSEAVTLSPKLTALAREQQKLQAKIQAQREREAEFDKKVADFVPKTTFKAKLQQNAVEALKDLGVDYEELTNLIVAQSQGEDPVSSLKAEIAKIKADQEESVNKQYEATLQQYRAETKSLIAKDPKKYFLITKEGAEEHVVQHIVETWEEDPNTVLTVEDAANEIEEFLREEAKQKKALLEELEGGAKEEAEEQPQGKKLPPPRTVARTLTQQIESTPSRVPNQFQHLSMKERIAQAIQRAQK